MHSDAAWTWFSRQADNRFFFSRLTQIGLLRLLATSAIMGEDVLTIDAAWKVYDRWLEDSRVAIWRETLELDPALRAATRPFSRLSSPKALGDCYLLAVSQSGGPYFSSYTFNTTTPGELVEQIFANTGTTPVAIVAVPQ